ncbi:hypothetical protein ASPZODRAFT_138299 [Penicilliopsis zonata CBS 506.65]|uniref:Uncharacterized protein n=1 Tax=Penicilliopsis zonata CBS 506.65 TaxID=1073090 RepID=A0A1L9SVD7_9EURO|nr:hypothetical protein ASPZODRAFT_138299 [Penicilliopsis zonata CBS 506.65]OJJ51192.1 hypothetical protein ASPZODRAFT_138299 [Penicilliopsis zonata CBS 506.65]
MARLRGSLVKAYSTLVLVLSTTTTSTTIVFYGGVVVLVVWTLDPEVPVPYPLFLKQQGPFQPSYPCLNLMRKCHDLTGYPAFGRAKWPQMTPYVFDPNMKICSRKNCSRLDSTKQTSWPYYKVAISSVYS